MKQRTIRKGFSLAGIGLHSGSQTKITVAPAKENSGICFIKDGRKVIAGAAAVEKTSRGTTIGGIAVVEHFLAAAAGLGVDNLEVKIDGAELPALDGSSLPYVQALKKAEIIEQAAEKNTLKLKSLVKLRENGKSLEALPYNGFKVDFMVNFPGVGEQKFVFDAGRDSFEQEVAPARTVGYAKEHEALKARGLGLGASLDNALVIGDNGYLNKPRFKDEIVRHKILDLIGDLALLGRPLEAEIKAEKTGHKMNLELVRRLLTNG